MAEEWIGQFGYFGIAGILILGGFGLPVPEELPIIAGAVLAREGRLDPTLTYVACLVGVLVGDFVVYLLGAFYGEKVLKLPIARKVLTVERERQISGYFERHGFKILIVGRFAVGFRTAAYLTAGILRLPPVRLFLTDMLAANLSTSLMFGLGWAFSYQIRQGLENFQQIFAVVILATVAIWLLRNYWKARKRAGRAVGPAGSLALDAPQPERSTHPAGDGPGQADNLFRSGHDGSGSALPEELPIEVGLENRPNSDSSQGKDEPHDDLGDVNQDSPPGSDQAPKSVEVHLLEAHPDPVETNRNGANSLAVSNDSTQPAADSSSETLPSQANSSTWIKADHGDIAQSR